MPADQHRLAIVTVTFNSAGVLPGFLRSLRRQRRAEFRLYAVDNASADGSAELLEAQQDPRIVVIRNDENLGFAEGSNQGIARAISDAYSHIMLLNNDTEYPETFFEELMSAARAGDYALFTPKIYYFDDPTRIWFAGGRFKAWLGNNPQHIGEGELDGARFNRGYDINFITGCCMLVSAEVFVTVGLLDEKYFAYLEDADFCLRARRSGFPMRYVPSAHLYHKVSSLTGGMLSAFSVRMGVRNRVYFLRKHLSMGGFLMFSTLYLCLLTARFLIGRDTATRFRLRLKAFREGLAMKPEGA